MINKYFTDDHRRLEELLHRAFTNADYIDEVVYAEFRSGLLRHIALEEKILLPALQEFYHGSPHPMAAQLRLEHGALTALLVPPPSRAIQKIFLGIFAVHNQKEECAACFYAACDALPPERVQDLFAKVQKYPAVPVMPYSTKENILEATRRAVNRAGFDFDQLSQ